MGNIVENYSSSSIYLCSALLVSSLAFTYFGFAQFVLSILVWVLSTFFILVKVNNKKWALEEKRVKVENLNDVHVKPLQENVRTQQNQLDPSLNTRFSPTDVYVSDSESGDDSITSEDFELNWISSNNVDQSFISSDEFISDEDDNLIEIALPKKPVYFKEEMKHKLEYSDTKDLALDSIFQQERLMELLAEIQEMNMEEENLIEIDISMGSIKCPNFEVLKV